MKKIELNAPLRFVLVILIWLLTFTVVNLTGTLNNGGAGLIGTLVLYVGTLYLAFVYFNDCQLKKACKVSLLVMVIIIMCYLFVQAYQYFLTAFEISGQGVAKSVTIMTGLFNLGKIIVMIVFLLLAVIQTLGGCNNEECCCKKEDKQVEAKEEAKEEAPAEEEKAEEKEAE